MSPPQFSTEGKRKNCFKYHEVSIYKSIVNSRGFVITKPLTKSSQLAKDMKKKRKRLHVVGV